MSITFNNSAGGPDGTDDGLPAFPYTPRDVNGNAVYEPVEYVPSGNLGSAPDENAASGEGCVGRAARSFRGALPHFLPLLAIIISIAMMLRRFTPGRGPN